jgi:hypothetical protein
MKTNAGGCIVPRILYLGTTWGERSSSRSGPFTLEKEPPLPIALEAGWPHRNRTPVVQPVA